MIPICLVTGFLGSGKTTLLKQIAARHADEKIVYLVNEFSPVDVDGLLLDQVEDDVIAIPGGSIFCKCLVTQFLGYLRSIPERFGRGDRPLSGVVIEASGVADPLVIERMLAETGLDETYHLATVIAIVDPGSLPKLVHTLPNIRAQVAAADVVLLNRTDQFADEAVLRAEGIVRTINEAASLVRTVRCDARVDLFGGTHQRGLDGEYAPCADPNFTRFSIAFDSPVQLSLLIEQLEASRDCIYRAKGFVPTDHGIAYLDLSEAGIEVEMTADDRPAVGLAIIGHGGAQRQLEALLETAIVTEKATR